MADLFKIKSAEELRREVEEQLRTVAQLRQAGKPSKEAAKEAKKAAKAGRGTPGGMIREKLPKGFQEQPNKGKAGKQAAALAKTPLVIEPNAAEVGGGIQILAGTSVPPPHTLQNAAGKFVPTYRWFDNAFLCYDPSIPVNPKALTDPDYAKESANPKGSQFNPWFGLSGREFRCYYPNSGSYDYKSCITSGSSGRWLQAWSQKSNYVSF